MREATGPSRGCEGVDMETGAGCDRFNEGGTSGRLRASNDLNGGVDKEREGRFGKNAGFVLNKGQVEETISS